MKEEEMKKEVETEEKKMKKGGEAREEDEC